MAANQRQRGRDSRCGQAGRGAGRGGACHFGCGGRARPGSEKKGGGRGALSLSRQGCADRGACSKRLIAEFEAAIAAPGGRNMAGGPNPSLRAMIAACGAHDCDIERPVAMAILAAGRAENPDLLAPLCSPPSARNLNQLSAECGDPERAFPALRGGGRDDVAHILGIPPYDADRRERLFAPPCRHGEKRRMRHCSTRQGLWKRMRLIIASAQVAPR